MHDQIWRCIYMRCDICNRVLREEELLVGDTCFVCLKIVEEATEQEKEEE